ncbi:hypothetical protein F4703DRAFT_1790057 [Phycomyces blakesleeanus]
MPLCVCLCLCVCICICIWVFTCVSVVHIICRLFIVIDPVILSSRFNTVNVPDCIWSCPEPKTCYTSRKKRKSSEYSKISKISKKNNSHMLSFYILCKYNLVIYSQSWSVQTVQTVQFSEVQSSLVSHLINQSINQLIN